MAIDFREIIGNLYNIGFYDVILPFILVYVIIFAILEKSKIFSNSDGSDKNQVKNVNSIIAFVFGLFVVASIQTVKYLQSFIMYAVIVIIFILVVLILLGFIFGDDYKNLFRNADGKVSGWVSWGIGIVVFLVALFLLFKVLGVWNAVFSWFDSTSISSNFGTYFILLLIGVVLYIVSKGDSK